MKFVDEVKISVFGGHGGRGIVSFDREKYRPNGGPSGGNGGRGGDIYLRASTSLNHLGKLLQKKNYRGANGETGRGQKQSGINGKSLVLEVPVGTEVLNEKDGTLLFDLSIANSSYILVKGGKGGLGNYNFKNSREQKPEYAQLGEPGEELQLCFRIKSIADAGLIGLTNAGKSTLLSNVSRKKAEIGNYPFTTLLPNIGLIENEEHRRIYLADIPGLIANASKGAGLGLSFLKHIERVSLNIYLLDGERFDFQKELILLQKELGAYKKSLLERRSIVVVNKCDLIDYDIKMQNEIKKTLSNSKFWKNSHKAEIIFISAKDKKGLDIFIKKLFSFFPQKTLAEQFFENQSSEKFSKTKLRHLA